jgi:hypothetical protein
MAKNEDDVILNIEVRYKDAIKSIAEYSVRLQDAKEKQAELKEEFKKGEISQREYAKQMALTKVTIDKNKAAVSALEKEIKNNIKAEHEEEGSLNALRGSLVNLTDQYNQLKGYLISIILFRKPSHISKIFCNFTGGMFSVIFTHFLIGHLIYLFLMFNIKSDVSNQNHCRW